MSNWIAKTKSGAVYRYEEGFLRISSEKAGHSSLIRPWVMKAVGHEVFTSNGTLDWGAIAEAENVEKPEIGKRFYVAGKEEWRLSTEILTVGEL